MILLDTNVISEPWRPSPDPHVLAWLDAQDVETLYLSAVTLAELRFGIAAMPVGKRQRTLHQRLELEVLPLFSGRVVAFDEETSRAYADLMSRAKATGKAIGKTDGYIAATAVIHHFAVATRDTGPFAAAGLKVVEPWRH